MNVYSFKKTQEAGAKLKNYTIWGTLFTFRPKHFIPHQIPKQFPKVIETIIVASYRI